MADAIEVLERQRPGGSQSVAVGRAEAWRQLHYELISGTSGLILAVFMWGHMFFVGSILLGTRGFDWLAETLEIVYIAQPTVVIIFALFVLHALTAARKIPAQMRERRRFIALARELKQAPAGWTGGLPAHVESLLWIWQVRTGLVVLVLGSFHLVLMSLDILTPLFGERVGIEAATSMLRTSAGLVWLYAVLLVAVEFHASVGLYRLAIKWGLGARIPRRVLHFIERVLLWFFLGLGALVLVVLAGWLDPPLEFLLD